MNKIVPILFFCLSVVTKNYAQDANKDSVLMLFKVMRQEEMIKQSFETISKATNSMVKPYMTDSKFKALIDEYMEKSMKQRIEMSNRILNEDLVGIYAKHYKQSEIEELLKFYRSPIGQKMLNESTLISQEYMEIYTAKYMPIYQKEMMEKMQTLMKEIQELKE